MFSSHLLAKPPKEIKEAQEIFDRYKVTGSVLLFDYKKNEYIAYPLERCNEGFCPASTFKIPNTLIALETGIATLDTVFTWDGKKRSYPRWEKDMNINDAFKASNVPVYQDIARRIGLVRMQYYVSLFHFGEMNIRQDNLDKFWLEDESKISQYQQIYFLTKLYRNEFPLKDETMMLTKSMMLSEHNEQYTIRSKTGWAVLGNRNIGWWVGYFEMPDNVYFFATNIEPTEQTDKALFGQIRIDLTKDFLSLVLSKQLTP